MSRDDSKLSVCDTIVSGKDGADIVWNMVTFAEPEIVSDKQIRLSSGTRCMLLTISSKITSSAFILPAGTDKPWDAQNPGASRVGFRYHIPADTEAVITVTLQDAV